MTVMSEPQLSVKGAGTIIGSLAQDILKQHDPIQAAALFLETADTLTRSDSVLAVYCLTKALDALLVEAEKFQRSYPEISNTILQDAASVYNRALALIPKPRPSGLKTGYKTLAGLKSAVVKLQRYIAKNTKPELSAKKVSPNGPHAALG